MTTLETIEAKLDRILALLEPKPKPAKRLAIPNAYTADFEAIWQMYPSRGKISNPKQSAYHAFNARIRAGETFSVLRDGVVAYRAYCDATGITGTSYVMQAVRFFGVNQEYLNEWIAPPKKEPLPRSNDEWLVLGRKMGVETRIGESWRDYIDRVKGAL